VKEKSTLALVLLCSLVLAAPVCSVSAAYSDTKFDLYSLHEEIGQIGVRFGAGIVPDNDILAWSEASEEAAVLGEVGRRDVEQTLCGGYFAAIIFTWLPKIW
jgi:hypothetical protein